MPRGLSPIVLSVLPQTPLSSPVPKWQQTWLALLAPLYFLSPLALAGLTGLKTMPRAAQGLLAGYLISQQLPALFTDTPLQASLTALLRTLLIMGLIGLGVSWQRSERLMPLSLGLVIVTVTAVLMTVLSGIPLLSSRLAHPYMTSITLGLTGALCIWLALFGQTHRLWRIFIGFAGVSVLLLSASRGPLLAAVVGIAAGLLVQSSRRVLLGAGLITLLAGSLTTISLREGSSLLTRLVQSDTNGRDLVWSSTLSAYQSSPLSGVGTYFLGRHLQAPGASCELWTGPSTTPTCPEWLQSLGSPWLIAHNGALQQLAETGPLGVMGFFMLVGSVVFTAWKSKDALGVSVLAGLLAATLTDNTLIVPSPFFAEAFWLIAGVQLSRLTEIKVGHGVTAVAALILLAFPIWVSSVSSKPRATVSGQLQFIQSPGQVGSAQNYTVYSGWLLTPGKYRLVMRSCLKSCALVQVMSVDTRGQDTINLESRGTIRNVPLQTLQLQLYPAEAGARVLPLTTHEWTVRIKP